jgi:hypothetical protein
MERSHGSPYLFAPETYSLGSGTREPSDLAWSCRDSLILITMQDSRDSYASQVEHNLKQVRGFLRLWDKGTGDLKGSSPYATFSIMVDDHDHLALLSIVSCDDARAEVHDYATRPGNQAEARLAVVASLPQSVMEMLAENGGSAADLAAFLTTISAISGGVDEDEALRLLRTQFDEGVGRAATSVQMPRDKALDELTRTWTVAGLRELPAARAYNQRAVNVHGGVSIFNDLDWERSHHVLYKLADLAAEVTVDRGLRVETVDVSPYQVVLAVCAPDDDMVARLQHEVQRHIDEVEARSGYEPTKLIKLAGTGTAISFHPRRVPASLTTRWLIEAGQGHITARS